MEANKPCDTNFGMWLKKKNKVYKLPALTAPFKPTFDSPKCPLMYPPCNWKTKEVGPWLIHWTLVYLLIHIMFLLPGFWYDRVLALTEPISCGLSLIVGCKPRTGEKWASNKREFC